MKGGALPKARLPSSKRIFPGNADQLQPSRNENRPSGSPLAVWRMSFVVDNYKYLRVERKCFVRRTQMFTAIDASV